MAAVELVVNGSKRRLETDADRTLLSVLRDDLELTGCKYGCGEGQCGACTVLIDDKARRSCLVRLADCDGKRITTIEGLEHAGLEQAGLAQGGKLHALQQAFLDVGAMQCGYCTPGMIMSGVALLARNPDPSPQEIVRSLDGNICRCGTYGRIVQAVRKAAEATKAKAQKGGRP
jgi:aerobic-type carbon monoxide dehydrogenase small subunit (CoxS/CutS family)